MSEPEVLFEGPHASVAHRLAVAVGTGAVLVGAVVFVRWGFNLAGPLVPPRVLAIAALVAVAMSVAALRSRVVWKVSVDHEARALLLHRDPGAVERVALADIAAVSSEAPMGGWSANPAERLVVTPRDGAAKRYQLLDEADTPGIVRDLRRCLDDGGATAG